MGAAAVLIEAHCGRYYIVPCFFINILFKIASAVHATLPVLSLSHVLREVTRNTPAVMNTTFLRGY